VIFPNLDDRLDDIRSDRDQASTRQEWEGLSETFAEVLLRNFAFTSLYDPTAFALLDRIGADRVMLEVDYPHQDSTGPHTQDVVDAQISHLPVETQALLTHGNAARLYRHPVPATWGEVSARGTGGNACRTV
jgi:hypothetical protein